MINPSSEFILALKSILKTKKKKKNQTDRTLGQMIKAKLYRQNHTQNHIHTHSQKKKKGNNIYILLLPKSASSIWDD